MPIDARKVELLQQFIDIDLFLFQLVLACCLVSVMQSSLSERLFIVQMHVVC